MGEGKEIKGLGACPSGTACSPTAEPPSGVSSASPLRPTGAEPPLMLLLADCRQALFDAVKDDEGASVALRYEIGRAIGLMGRAMDDSRKSATACDCIEVVNAKLAERNTRIMLPIMFGADQTRRPMIETEQIETGRGKQKASGLFATFCPFCGVRLAKSEGR